MPHLTLNGARIHYTDEGEGAETIVFSHGLLFSGRMFGAQVAELKDRFRCITFDHRGQGQSAVTDSGYDIDTLAEDAAGLIEKLGVGPCHFVGLSMGGFVGMRLAAHRPDLIRSLTLLDTSADPEPTENHGQYKLLNFIARWFGLRVVVGQVMPILFGQTFLKDRSKAAERKMWRDEIVKGDRLGITRAVSGVIGRAGVAEHLGRINCPTIVLVGEEDVATPPDKSKAIQVAIPSADLVLVPKAGHSSTIEQPEFVTKAISEFVSGVGKTAPSDTQV